MFFPFLPCNFVSVELFQLSVFCWIVSQSKQVRVSNSVISKLSIENYLKLLKGMGNKIFYFILNISFESTFKIIY